MKPTLYREKVFFKIGRRSGEGLGKVFSELAFLDGPCVQVHGGCITGAISLPGVFALARWC